MTVPEVTVSEVTIFTSVPEVTVPEVTVPEVTVPEVTWQAISIVQVMRFIEGGVLLSRPTGCPPAMYDVMLGCWNGEPSERLAFSAIHSLVCSHLSRSKSARRQEARDRWLNSGPLA